MTARNDLRAARVLNGMVLGFGLAALIIMAVMPASLNQEPNLAVMLPLAGGLGLGIPAGAIVGMRLPEWPAEFPGAQPRAWLWGGVGVFIGMAIGFGWGASLKSLIFVALSGSLAGLEIAALLHRAASLVRTLALMVMLSVALWVGNWAWNRHEQREHWRRTRPGPPAYRVTPRPAPTPGPTLADDLKALRKLSPQTEAVERVIQTSRRSVEARQGIIVFLKEAPTPTEQTADGRFPLSQILLGLHRYPFPEAATALIALDKRCTHKADVLGDRVILAIIDCDTPAGRKYVREQLARKERTVSVGLAMLRAQNPWGQVEAEAALRKRGELQSSPDGKSRSFQRR